MSRLFYMSLPGVGPWDKAMKDAGSQFRPYFDYLWTARKAAERRRPTLAWRRPTAAEVETLQRRQRERHEEALRRARAAQKRRDRRIPATPPQGAWIILEPPPWKQEEPETTFDAFMDADEIYDAVDERGRCLAEGRIEKRDFDQEARALLLEREPTPGSRSDDGEDENAPSTEPPWEGPLVCLRPNTYTLECQIRAIEKLDNQPSPRLAPLSRLVASRPSWEDVDPVEIEDDEWVFLTDEDRDGTDEQREWVRRALGSPEFALLEGPPGSGKTHAICEFIVQLARRGLRVMLVASTHVAVDNVLERLIRWQDQAEEKLVLPVRIGDDGRITADEVKPFALRRLMTTWRDELQDFLEDPKGTDPAGSEARDTLKEALGKTANPEDSPIIRLILDSANLVCGTTIGILQHPYIKAMRKGGSIMEPFDVLILDEASKTTFTEFLVPAVHAKRWAIVGDVKQLSPYVEEQDLAENLRGLLPEEAAIASVFPFLASPECSHRVPGLVAVESDELADLITAEAEARGVRFVDLDRCDPGKPVLDLLHADLVLGSSEAMRTFEHRLPGELSATGGGIPDLPDWEAHRHALGTEIPDEPVNWADEMAWRLVRSYELRMNETDRARLKKEIDALLPKTLGTSYFDWRKRRPRIFRSDQGERTQTAAEMLLEDLDNVRRVAMPSILELLQRGFEKLPWWDQDVALTGGLPKAVLDQRLVSLRYQHRMHPDISAFPREQFYTLPGPEIPAHLQQYIAMGYESWVRAQLPEPAEPLLQDASGMEDERRWSFDRYGAGRAVWQQVHPDRKRQRGNRNPAEVRVLLRELDAFVEWAGRNPKRDREGRVVPWEVAMLTFYRGQEAELRVRLQQKSGQMGNSRNFQLPHGKPSVHITLCTVDRFQGHEADVVYLSFVKSGTVGFLNSPNRLNVALTRARYQIALVGDREFFKSDRCRSDLLRSLAASEHYPCDLTWESAR